MVGVEDGERHQQRQQGQHMEGDDETGKQRDRTHVVAADVPVKPVHPHGRSPTCSA